ncbi:MAG: PHP domain-containing protein [Patescibacteria group bacterium]|nr:PHP domain-containing protein [Patescibacteria group bacterium]MDD5715969.1 PHP domain-containing protein [Patescibacteria group bacterium]
MRQFIDLHVHSHYSEGDYSVNELLQRAQSENISALALADHNTIAGIQELLTEAPRAGIKAIVGIELYVHHNSRQLHILGYNFSTTNAALASSLAALRKDNARNVTRSIHSLEEQGYTISEEAILALPSQSIGVIHLLRELESFEANRVKMQAALPAEKQTFFEKISYLFGFHAPAHFPVSALPAGDAIKLIHGAGGSAVLAHPGQQLTHADDSLIRNLARLGLDGLEVLSPYHTWHQIEYYQHLAQELKLLMTGGSDFHGDFPANKQGFLKSQLDYFKIPVSFLNGLTTPGTQ